MDKKEWAKIAIVYIVVFFIAVFMDIKDRALVDENLLYREKNGGESKEIELLMDAENVLEDYKVNLEIAPRRMTKKEAEACFLKAIQEIDTDMMHIETAVGVRKTYADGLVTAQWSFLPTNAVSADGTIQNENISEDGVIVTATVELCCDSYEKIYQFPLRIYKVPISTVEAIERELAEWIKSQQEREGTEEFLLPDTLAGIPVTWSEKKEFLTSKILFLELISGVLFVFARKKEQADAIERRRMKRERLYPEIVNQLLILMEAGMTTRQAWHKIASQYVEKKKLELVEESEVYEAIVQMDRRLTEGENERSAYENFAIQMDVMCYRRLVRLFVHNLEKGSRDICQYLNLEAKQAYEQRILQAKKQGEEASTKMLIPMMLMMVLVMVIILAPAIMGFSL